MDAFIILLLVIVIICWACYRRQLSTAAYGIAALDIFLQIIDFISKHIGANAVSNFFSKFPDSLLWVADRYTNGIIFFLLAWAFIILMIYFLFLTVMAVFRR